MRKRFLKVMLCAILSTMIALSASFAAFATETNCPDILFEVKTDENGFQYIKENENVKADKIKVNDNLIKSISLPSEYNLADYNQVTGIKNQNPYGTCWAFSAISSIESTLIKSGNADSSVDLSEKHLIWFNYNGADSSTDKSLYAGNDSYNSLGYS